MNPLNDEFINCAKKYFEFLINEYGFSGPLINKQSAFVHVVYTKGTLGLIVQFETKEQSCDLSFYDLTTGFPPDPKNRIYPTFYFDRLNIISICNTKEIFKKNYGIDPKFTVELRVCRSAEYLKCFPEVLKMDKFIH